MLQLLNIKAVKTEESNPKIIILRTGKLYSRLSTYVIVLFLAMYLYVGRLVEGCHCNNFKMNRTLLNSCYFTYKYIT